MRKSRLLVGAVLAITIIAGPASGSSPRTEQHPYVGGIGHPCGVSKICFELDGTETSVDLVIKDDFQEHVGGTYLLLGPSSGPGSNLGLGSFCDSISLQIPAEATEFSLYLNDTYLIPSENHCSPQFTGDTVSDEGIMGVVTATFR